MKIIKNTYPQRPNVPHGKPGDVVYWSLYRGQFNLIRKSDGKTVFATAAVDRDGNLRSNGKQPTLCGVIAQVKRKGWSLEVAYEKTV